MVYLMLADGFEVTEALTTVDVLRRAKVDLLTVGVTGKEVTASCKIKVEADISPDEVELDRLDAVISALDAVFCRADALFFCPDAEKSCLDAVFPVIDARKNIGGWRRWSCFYRDA